MTEIEAKALELLNVPDWPYEYEPDDHPVKVLCRAIEQHEAFKQEVSDAVSALLDRFLGDMLSQGVINGHLHQFIIPKPKPDPLEEVLTEIDHAAMWVDKCAEEIRASLGARGWEIREKGQ
jgi:hypothetical protein